MCETRVWSEVKWIFVVFLGYVCRIIFGWIILLYQLFVQWFHGGSKWQNNQPSTGHRSMYFACGHPNPHNVDVIYKTNIN